MLRYKFAGIRALMDVTIYFLLYLSYQYGVILGERIFGFDYWFIDFVYGAITAACANYLISLVKKYIFLIFKCGTIWSICNPEETSIIAVLQKVTCDWKETFSIPIINIAIRNVLNKFSDFIKDKNIETPEFLKSIENSQLFNVSKKLLVKTFDYADECTLAWSYSHDDPLLSECLTGLGVFIANSAKLVLYITPVIILQSIIRIICAMMSLWGAIQYLGISIDTIVPIYIIVLGVDFILYDAILEPFTMDSVVRKYMSYKDMSDEKINSAIESISSVVSLDELKSILKRFTGGTDETSGDNSEIDEGASEERMDPDV